MASLIAWLDATAEDQRAARELVALFSQTESRDELGIGQVRDALSETLFPGTSTLHTRARYFLLIPWCYTRGKAGAAVGDQVRIRGRQQERELIEVLRNQTESESGLIGVRAGAGLKNLPSSLYWSGMQQYGIVAPASDAASIGAVAALVSDGATEAVERASSLWRPDIPAPPGKTFPTDLTGGFDLTQDEADWLRERIVASHPGSALAHMLTTNRSWDGDYPWPEISLKEFPLIGHAELFSGLMNGAALLYNLLIAEAYDANDQLTRFEDKSAEYRTAIDTWHTAVLDGLRPRLATWDTADLWQIVGAQNQNVSPLTRQFVEGFVHDVRALGPADRVYDSGPLKARVRKREERKGKQSRLLNPKMLAVWSGASGTGRLGYRWSTVKTLVDDIRRGRQGDASS